MKERIICIMFAAILCISLVPESRTKAAELKTEWSGDELAFVAGKDAAEIIFSSAYMMDKTDEIDPLKPNETTEYTYSIRIWNEDNTKIVVVVSQHTDWNYAPGISSSLTKCVLSYSGLLNGYSVVSGGDTITTNNDGTQQVVSYFRIVNPDGIPTHWYKMVSICSVNGVVSGFAQEVFLMNEGAQPEGGEIILPVNKTANSSTSDLTARWLPEGTELAQPWENEISPDNDWIMRWMQPEGGEIILSTKKPENSSTSDLTVRWLPEGTKLAWPWETEISPDDDRTVRWTGPKDGKIILPIEKADSYSFSDLTVRWLPAGTELPWPWETEISPDDDRTVRWTRPEAVE